MTNHLREHRQRQHLSLRALAERAHMSHETVRTIEVGISPGSRFTRSRLAEVLAVAERELFPNK